MNLLSRKKLLHLIWILPVLCGLYLSIHFLVVYIQWNNRQDEVLDKLVTYKRQLDYISNPMPSEEKAGKVYVGAVAIPSRIYDRNNQLIGEFLTERRSLIPIERVPPYLAETLIINEDRQFYEHGGINYKAIMRAFLVNLLELRIAQGGSTLTQQLSKVLFTRQQKTLSRKIFEFFCAREIEHRFTKEEILEMYINLIYLGHGNYGFESASQYYFNKSASDLSQAEVAMLVGIVPNPGLYSPIRHLDNSLKRQKIVLQQLVHTGRITSGNLEKILKDFRKTWNIRSVEKTVTSDIAEFPDRAYRLNRAPFFLDHIRQRLLEKFSHDVLTRGGLRIYTTLDYRRQLSATRALTAAVEKQRKYYSKLIENLKKKGRKDKAEFYRAALERTNGAFVSIEPASGYVLSMVGGYEFSSKNQFNRALKAKRQIGSIMKPLVYYLGLTQKIITPASIIKDTELKIGKIKFRNYDHKYMGEITTRTALKKSRNTPAVRLLQKTGINELRRVLADILDEPYSDMEKRIPNEAGVALGTPVFTPMEVATIYATFANRGMRVKPRELLRVEDSHGKILWENDETPPEVQVLDPVATYITISMMQATFEDGGTAGWVGRLREKDREYLPFEIAGKTGTTSDYKDAWFTGMTSDEVVTIWIGNDQNRTLGRGRSGGTLCSPAFINYIRSVRQNNTPPPFSEKWELEDTTRESFCADSGLVPRAEGVCPEVIENQVFFSGTEPRSFDPRQPEPEDFEELEKLDNL